MAEVTRSRSAPVPVLAPVDPRLRRRRAQVRREAGRRRLRALVAALVLSVVVIGGWTVLHSPVLDVDRVVVTGMTHLQAGDVRAAAAVELGTALVDVDPQAIGERVRGLGRVGAVDVSRVWPGTVEIAITERQPVAVTSLNGSVGAGGGRWVVLDGAGRALEVADSAPPGLIRVEGAGTGPVEVGERVAGLEGAMSVVRALPPALLPQVATVIAAGDDVDLGLASGGVVYLGPPERVGEKLRALATVLARVDTTGMRVLDLRQPSRPALTRR